ncbi:ubiquinol--cytochrome-c reductase subunit 8 [Coelomomyces lativittatus]|nr:ubiquinol--cytochrome-c reductase subunit 8 [Coelomomyces lativittatus]KAJ1516289.1 ubiquinol--cytochrome-c reductase subunit 8 [Coelomomyces lativittatus]KAJ1516910.1 ubiquinol--cytochrome-c reductase subunit 8 [Coelomomyces lativittatus]
MGGGLHQRWWGDLCKPHEQQNGVITYQLSPFRQKAFGGFFKKGFHNQARKFKIHAPYIIPPFVLGYFVLTKAIELNEFYHSKASGHGGH